MFETAYWQRRTLGRRAILRGATIGGLGLAASALIGCGSGRSSGSKPGAAIGGATGSQVGTATGTAAVSANAKKGGRLQIYAVSSAPNLDPVLSISTHTHNRISLVYQNLVEMSRGPKGIYDTVIGPDLAQSWETAADGLTWTFKLRPGTKWANVAPMNGRPVTADDVVFSFQRNLSPNAGNLSRFEPLDGPPKAIDANTVQFKLKYPHPGFFFTMAGDPSEITPRDAVEKNGDLKNWGAGSGPFIMTKYEPQQVAAYKKNPDYWDAANVHLDGVDWVIIPEFQTAIANFRSGQLDMLGGRLEAALLPSDADAIMKSVPKAQRVDGFEGNIAVIEMNFKSPLFKDLRVRQAVSMALDRKAHISALAGGVGKATGTFPYPRFPEYALADEELGRLLPFNVAEAKKLMAAAGVGDGFTAKIMWRTDTGQTPLNVHIEMLKQIGITLDTKAEAVDYPAWVSKSFNGNFTDMAEWGYTVGSIWDYVVGLHTIKGNRNGPQHNIPELDAMVQKVIRTVKPEDQIAMVKDIERYALSKALYIVPTIVSGGSVVQQPYLRDVNPGFGAVRGVYMSSTLLRRSWLDK